MVCFRGCLGGYVLECWSGCVLEGVGVGVF